MDSCKRLIFHIRGNLWQAEIYTLHKKLRILNILNVLVKVHSSCYACTSSIYLDYTKQLRISNILNYFCVVYLACLGRQLHMLMPLTWVVQRCTCILCDMRVTRVIFIHVPYFTKATWLKSWKPVLLTFVWVAIRTGNLLLASSKPCPLNRLCCLVKIAINDDHYSGLLLTLINTSRILVWLTCFAS